jgi:hypothetical protein
MNESYTFAFSIDIPLWVYYGIFLLAFISICSSVLSVATNYYKIKILYKQKSKDEEVL